MLIFLSFRFFLLSLCPLFFSHSYLALLGTTPTGCETSTASGDLSVSFRSKISSWHVFEKLASNAPATVPVAKSGAC